VTDAWDPQTYERFGVERRQPFDDLLALVQPCPGGRVVDLGCGTGALTAELHRHSQAAHTVGIDRSAAMLARAEEGPGLQFDAGDLATFETSGFDLVFSNAALQWSAITRHCWPGWSARSAPAANWHSRCPPMSTTPPTRWPTSWPERSRSSVPSAAGPHPTTVEMS